MGNLLTRVGAVITVIYSLIIFWLTSNRVGQLTTMPLNELGDFLAGVFGPLVIFWLILGFLQQGKELQQSTKALELQAKELNNSVQQQEKLVEVSRQRMEAEIESLRYERQKEINSARPNFIFQGSGAMHSANLSSFETVVKNVGGGITNVLIETDRDISLSPASIYSWETNQEEKIKWEYKKGESEDMSNIIIRYTDGLGKKGEETFIISISNDAQRPVAEIYEKANKVN